MVNADKPFVKILYLNQDFSNSYQYETSKGQSLIKSEQKALMGFEISCTILVFVVNLHGKFSF